MERVKKRLLELDALRGIAAFMVVLFHYTTKFGEIFHTQDTSVIEFKYGHYGVQLFFIISGFVIFLTIQNIKTGLEFVKKRFIRLYPTFWFCLLLTFLITSVAEVERFKRSWQELVVNFTMLPELFHTRMVDGVYWSLLPEMIFYTLILVCFKLHLLKKIELLCYIWMAICVINIYFIGSSILIVLSLSMYCYLFIAGINFYKIWAQEGGIKNHIQILVCFLFSILTQPFLESFFVLLFFALFYLFIYRKLEFITRIKFLVFLGVVSYPFYLIHQFLGMIIIYYTRQYISTNFIVLLVAPLIITIAIAFLINRYFEEWATLKFKKILFPKQ